LAGKRGVTGSIGVERVRDLPPNSEIFDAGKGAASGFGARRRTGPAVSYFVMYRTADGRQRRYTIGRHGAPWTPDTARLKAREILGEVAAGADPADTKRAKRDAATVNELLDQYWSDATAGRVLVRGGKPKKASTLASDKGRIDGHMRPLLGRLKVAAVTRSDVKKFMDAVAAGETKRQAKTDKKRGKSIVRGGKGVATRAMGLLGAIFAYAVENHYRADNPVHGVRKFAENKRERRISDAEYAVLGQALAKADAEKIWPAAVAAARFLALTGWRSGEALALRWDEIDVAKRTARLPDTKTGASMRPLSTAALAVLPTQAGEGLVFKPSRGKTTMTGFGRFWDKIAALGPLPPDISPHILRHSFASVAGDLGYSESTTGALIGHKSQSVTGRYIHSADAVLLAAADAVADEIVRRMALCTAQSKCVDLAEAPTQCR
jgi:integrase